MGSPAVGGRGLVPLEGEGHLRMAPEEEGEQTAVWGAALQKEEHIWRP